MSSAIDAHPGIASDRKTLTGPGASTPALHWLPVPKDWRGAIRAIEQESDDEIAWQAMVALANTRLDFLQIGRLDRALQARFGANPPAKLATKPVRLAVLGSSTTGHLLPPIRVGGLRRGLWVTCYEPDYGQYLQEVADASSELHGFKPTAVLLTFDAFHLLRGAGPTLDEAGAAALVADIIQSLCSTWADLRSVHKCALIQQTAMPLFPTLLGSNEHRLPGSPARLVTRLNEAFRHAADQAGVDLLALDDRLSADGIRQWHDPVLWHRAKQEVTPTAAPFYGDMVARLLAAQQGRSSKCLVLDLDNTLWGGVIGDDGLEGIVLGQGSAHGEAFVGFQKYALDLSKRGVILAVCSKNDEANAFLPFDKHPEMILRRTDIACFVANWSDKAANIRQIAHQLNIGLDSLVFVDDNPFERNLVRDELPMVAVPEVSADPSHGLGRRVFRERCDHRRRPRADRAVSRQPGTHQFPGRHGRPAGLSARLGDATGLEAIRRRRPGAGDATDQQNQPVQPDDPALLRPGRSGGDRRSQGFRIAAPPDRPLR